MYEPEYGFTAQYARIRPQPAQVPPGLADEIAHIEQRLGELEEISEHDWNDGLAAKADRLHERRAGIDETIDGLAVYSDKDRAISPPSSPRTSPPPLPTAQRFPDAHFRNGGRAPAGVRPAHSHARQPSKEQEDSHDRHDRTAIRRIRCRRRRYQQAPFFFALGEMGIHRVTVEYDGSGDSGQIEAIEAWNATNEKIPLPSTRKLQLASQNRPCTEMSIEAGDRDARIQLSRNNASGLGNQ